MTRLLIPVRALGLSLVIASLQTIPSSAQTISVDTAYDGTVVVTGQADPGSGPFQVYDTSYEVPAAIGKANVIDTNGSFAVAVSPPLREGDSILVEDALGNQSQSVDVIASPDLDAE